MFLHDRAVRRRFLHPHWNDLRFPEMIRGVPKPVSHAVGRALRQARAISLERCFTAVGHVSQEERVLRSQRHAGVPRRVRGQGQSHHALARRKVHREGRRAHNGGHRYRMVPVLPVVGRRRHRAGRPHLARRRRGQGVRVAVRCGRRRSHRHFPNRLDLDSCALHLPPS